MLKRGITTTSAGGFFFIPYLLQLDAYRLATSLGPGKEVGIPQERIAIGIVFESIFGYTAGIRAIDSVSRADFGLLAGLRWTPKSRQQNREFKLVFHAAVKRFLFRLVFKTSPFKYFASCLAFFTGSSSAPCWVTVSWSLCPRRGCVWLGASELKRGRR